MTADFPNSIWDGREPSRPDGALRAPSPKDWAEAVSELRAVESLLISSIVLLNNLGQTAIPALTDETTGTPDGTLELIGDTSTDQSTNLNKNFAELNAKVDAIIAALVTAGILLAEDA